MAIIHWWLLQIDPEDIDEFGIRYANNYHVGGMSAEDAIDAAGKSILADKGLVPGQQYLWPKPAWAEVQKLKYVAEQRQ